MAYHQKSHFSEEEVNLAGDAEDENDAPQPVARIPLPPHHPSIIPIGGNGGQTSEEKDSGAKVGGEGGEGGESGGLEFELKPEFRDVDPTDETDTTSQSYTPLHSKNSIEKDYGVQSTPRPPQQPATIHSVTKVEIGESNSLKTLHKADIKAGGVTTFDGTADVTVHQKQSREKNGKNPEDLPEGWSTPPPTLPPVEESIERVNAAPTPTYSFDSMSNNPPSVGMANSDIPACTDCPSCTSKSGGVYGDDRQSSKNGGVVLRYQYEMVVDGSVERDLTNVILPGLEEAASDWLLPVFFPDECAVVDVGSYRGGGRLLEADVDGEEEMVESLEGGVDVDGVIEIGEGKHEFLRHRKLRNVVGLSAAPPDFPLEQEECEINNIPTNDPLSNIRCYRMEGGLTLYFPPNYDASTLLSSTTLTTLQSIHSGMKSGSLAAMSHEAILSLIFLESSYSLVPIVPPEWKERERESAEQAMLNDEVSGGKSSNAGAIAAGVIVPIVLLCCMAGLFVAWRRRKERMEWESYEDSDENLDFDPAMDIYPEKKSKKKSMFRRNRRRSSDTDEEEGEGEGVDKDIEGTDGDTDEDKTEKKKKKKKSKKARKMFSRRSLRSIREGEEDQDDDEDQEEVLATFRESGERPKSRRSRSKRFFRKSKSSGSHSERSRRSYNSGRSARSRNSAAVEEELASVNENHPSTSEDTSNERSSTTSSGTGGSTTTSGSASSTTSGTNSREYTSSSNSREEYTDSNTDSSYDSTTSSGSDGDSTTSSEEGDEVSDIRRHMYFHDHDDFDLQRDLAALSKPKKRVKRKMNKNIVMGGRDDISVATGMTGMYSDAPSVYSEASTVKLGARRDSDHDGSSVADMSVMTGVTGVYSTASTVKI